MHIFGQSNYGITGQEKDQALKNSLVLPPIPASYVRLTHFTGKGIASALLTGQNFNYSMLQSTTDAHSNNGSVSSLVTSGNVGPFSRSEFGDAVVIIDVPPDEYKKHLSSNFQTPGGQNYIANSKIAGIVDLSTMRFVPNSNYNPSGEAQFVETSRLGGENVENSGQSVETPSPPDVNSEDNSEETW